MIESSVVDNSFALLCLFLVAILYNLINRVRTNQIQFLVNLVLRLTLPALLFLSLNDTDIGRNTILVLPVIGFLIPTVLFLCSKFLSKKLLLDPKVASVFITSSTIANLGFFLYPIISIAWGNKGISSLAMYDVGNTIFAYTVNSFVSIKNSQKKKPFKLSETAQRAFLFPPLVAILAGLLVNFLNVSFSISVPTILITPLRLIAEANSFLAMLILGFCFKIQMTKPRLTVYIVTLRMVGGFFLGFLAVTIFGLTGLQRTIALLAPAMPVGISNILFAIRYDLDIDLAASSISLSLLLGFITIFFLYNSL